MEVKAEDFDSIIKTLQNEGVAKVRIRGNSMNPLLSELDHVTIFPLRDLNSIKRFDVIVFWQHNILMCHYFWKRNAVFNPDVLLTRPLNPINGYDHPINQSQVLGIAKLVKISSWLKFKIIISTILNKKSD